MAGWAGPVVALIAIYAVHRLTQLRDKEKAVFELHKTIGESVGNTKTVILTAWEDPDATKRQAAIEQTKWRLQQLGGLVERLRKMSKRWRCQRRSEEHTSELQSLMRISHAVFGLKKKQ